MSWSIFVVPMPNVMRLPHQELVRLTEDSLASVATLPPGIDAKVVGVNLGALSGSILGYRRRYTLVLPAGDKISYRFLAEAEPLFEAGADVIYPSVHQFGENYGHIPALRQFTDREIAGGASLPVASPFRVSLVEELGGIPDNPFDWWREFYKIGANFIRIPGIHYFRRT